MTEARQYSQGFQFELLAHPDQPLVKHLTLVAEECRSLLRSKALNLEKDVLEVLPDICYLVGGLHDIGKGTGFFQEYIRATEQVRAKLSNDPKKHHSFLSSLFVYVAVKDLISKHSPSKDGLMEILPALAFLAVKKHHSNMYDSSLDREAASASSQEATVRVQLDSMRSYKDAIDRILLLLGQGLDRRISISFDENRILKSCREIGEIPLWSLNRFKQKLKTAEKDAEKSLGAYCIFSLIYSILLSCDRSNILNTKVDREDIDPEAVESYIRAMRGSRKEKRLDGMRADIFERVAQRADLVDVGREKIFSLNIPTGLGKTLTSLSFALKLRKLIAKEKEYTPRIIYSLPFITIIEQNFGVIKDVLKSRYGHVASSMLIAHHHLSDNLSYTTPTNEYSIDESELLVESWSSEIIVTTFVQFFHSIISDNRKMSIKFHNIVNSIVILDEVQSLPFRLWEVVRFAIIFLSKVFGVYFILTTATLPFFLRKEEYVELVENKEEIFRSLNRVELLCNLTESTLEDVVENVASEIDASSGLKFLIVLNTLREWWKFGRLLEKRLMGKHAKILYLSSLITPMQRTERIETVKKTKGSRIDKDERPTVENEKLVVVSTQVIEAGVDLDFDMVFRDIGPLPSIFQVCGRCNREWESPLPSKAHLFQVMRDEGDQNYAEQVYESQVISQTRRALIAPMVSESDFLKLSDRFYDLMDRTLSKDLSFKIIKAVSEIDFRQNTPYASYRIIEREENFDFFALIGDRAKELWSRYQECLGAAMKANGSLQKYITFKHAFAPFKPEFYQYVVSVQRYIGESLSFASTQRVGSIAAITESSYSSKDIGLGLTFETMI